MFGPCSGWVRAVWAPCAPRYNRTVDTVTTSPEDTRELTMRLRVGGLRFGWGLRFFRFFLIFLFPFSFSTARARGFARCDAPSGPEARLRSPLARRHSSPHLNYWCLLPLHHLLPRSRMRLPLQLSLSARFLLKRQVQPWVHRSLAATLGHNRRCSRCNRLRRRSTAASPLP
jgi:hypothetical protein